ncbi:hypothetical protein EVAR_75550_1 [Eumeta japonica]|uniref:Uncharacterized protein n=1 Tax=Eumeta variegata TaxID=151549 RepID=A0A4C1UJ20_EUMVA|nr:hypothetical protein EVAR_75550_1 [Eumeta japonica]
MLSTRMETGRVVGHTYPDSVHVRQWTCTESGCAIELRFPEIAGDQEELSVGTPTSSSTVTAVSGSDGEVKFAPRTRGGAEYGKRTGKGCGATTRVALMGALRIPGATRAHGGRDRGSLHAGGALPEIISP